MKVLTWHVHGAYLYYLAQVPHTFYLPVKPGRPEGYGGRAGHLPWPANLVEVPAPEVRHLDLDVVLTQSLRNWRIDRHELLGLRAADLPTVHLEHDPPRRGPDEPRHPVQDEQALLVHCTPFNALMWDSGITPSRIVEHGVAPFPARAWTGEIARGITVVNGLYDRGPRLGPDVFDAVAREAPLDLAGFGSADRPGGLGDLPLPELHRRLPAYRLFFHPIRWTSLGLAVLEAMALGLPVVGLATTELATVVENGVSGFVDTRIDVLAGHVRRLLADPDEAAALSKGARERAATRFGIDRFARDWDAVLREAKSR